MRIGIVLIHPTFVFTLLCFFLAENSVYSLAVLFCAAFHEMGHIAAIYAQGASVAELSLLPFGAQIRLTKDVGYKKEAIIAASGPIFGAVLSALFFPLSIVFNSELLFFCAVCSLWLSAINILPARGFDGARILKCAFLQNFEYEKALTLIKSSELVSLVLLTLCVVATIIFSSCNLSLCAICIYLLFSASGCDY